MGAVISLLICAAAAYLLYGTGHEILFFGSIVLAGLTFWSIAMMYKYAISARRDRADRLRENLKSERRLDNNTEKRIADYRRGMEPEAVPDGLAVANMLLFVASVALLIAAFVVK